MRLVHLFDYFARVQFCPLFLPLGIRDWLRLVIVALLGTFYLHFVVASLGEGRARLRVYIACVVLFCLYLFLLAAACDSGIPRNLLIIVSNITLACPNGKT